MVELHKTQITQLADLAGYGDKTAATTLQNMLDTLKATSNLSEDQIAAIKLLELELLKLRHAAILANNAISTGHNTGGQGDHGRAGGGYVPPGWTGSVGEQGTEGLITFPGGGAYVIPHASSMDAGASSGGGGDTYQFNITNPVPHAAEEDIGRLMHRRESLGMAGE
jgi:hypothetical protein